MGAANEPPAQVSRAQGSDPRPQPAAGGTGGGPGRSPCPCRPTVSNKLPACPGCGFIAPRICLAASGGWGWGWGWGCEQGREADAQPKKSRASGPWAKARPASPACSARGEGGPPRSGGGTPPGCPGCILLYKTSFLLGCLPDTFPPRIGAVQTPILENRCHTDTCLCGLCITFQPFFASCAASIASIFSLRP